MLSEQLKNIPVYVLLNANPTLIIKIHFRFPEIPIALTLAKFFRQAILFT